MLTLRNSILYAANRPFLRFASTAQAGVYMLRLGYRACERALPDGTAEYHFWR